jgi:energy-coupling factor transport system ATP-binding protein
MACIDIKNLSYWYPEEAVEKIKDVSIQVDEGEILFLIGKSGSGKSTLGKIISGAIPNFYGGKLKGTVSINKKLLKDMEYSERAKDITMVFQDPERQLMMNTVHREIAFGLENVGVEDDQIKRRVWESMQFSGITELAHRNINTLSGGQKQKVAIASAIAYLPKCIIFDEPTSQLDPSSAEEVLDLIKKINEELGVTVILIEQRVDRCFDLADKIAFLDEGVIKFHGTKEEFYKFSRNNLEEFLPTYLRLASYINMDCMPKDLKTMRGALSNYSFTFVKPNNENSKISKDCITIKNLCQNYDEIRALKNINLNVKEGEFIGVLGANGAGKSTLLRAITGLNKYEGSIKLHGNEVRKLKLNEISKIAAYVSQNPNDYISKDTVYEEIKFTLNNHGINDYSRIDDVLKKLDIYKLKDKNPRDISGGERQRVAIASMLVINSKILLLDEPTRGLDINIKRELGKMLKKLNESGTTIILITHDIEFASDFCNKFILMFNGEIVAEGSREKILTNGIFYTTVINKLFRSYEDGIFTTEQIMELQQ